MKYPNVGGPDLAACFGLLREATRPSATQVLRLLDAVVFNDLVGNLDQRSPGVPLEGVRASGWLVPAQPPFAGLTVRRLAKGRSSVANGE